MPDDPEAISAFLAATERVYHAFRNCRGRANWSDCLDVLTPERESRPARLPAKELSDKDVDYFFSHSGYTTDNADLVAGVKYFLPRVLEAFVKDDQSRGMGMVFDPWFIVERLEKANWLTWPSDQLNPVKHWFDAWRVTIVKYQSEAGVPGYSIWELPCNRKIDVWLKFAGKLDLDTAPLIAEVEAGQDRLAVNLVDACVSDFGKTLSRKQRLWEADDPANQQPLLNWLLAWKTEQRMENAFFGCRHPRDEWIVSKVLESLRELKDTLPSYG